MKRILLILIGIFVSISVWSQNNPSSSKPGAASKEAQLKSGSKEDKKPEPKAESKRRIIVQINLGYLVAKNQTTQFDNYRKSYNQYYLGQLSSDYQFKEDSRGQEFGFSIFYKVFDKMIINTGYYFSNHGFSDKAVFSNNNARQSDFKVASHNYLFSFGFGNYKNSQARGITFDLNYYHRTERINNYYLYPNAGPSISAERGFNGVYKGVRNGLGIGLSGYLPIYRRLGSYLKVLWVPENRGDNHLIGRAMQDTWDQKPQDYSYLPQDVVKHQNGETIFPEDRVNNSAGSISLSFGLTFNLVR